MYKLLNDKISSGDATKNDILHSLGLKKNRCVSANMPKKIRVGRLEHLFIFLHFFLNKIRSKMFLWVTIH